MPDKKLTDNEVVKAIPFEKKIAYYKENIKEFFNRYKNESGAEDCIEVCLIREGYRTVLKAEEEINRLQTENERLKNAGDNKTEELLRHNTFIKELHEKLKTAKAEAYKEFAERCVAEFCCRGEDRMDCNICENDFLEIIKELVGEDKWK